MPAPVSAPAELLLPPPRIVSRYIHPPIPRRDFDWCAFIEGTEEDGPFGWGATEGDAVADLIINCSDE